MKMPSAEACLAGVMFLLAVAFVGFVVYIVATGAVPRSCEVPAENCHAESSAVMTDVVSE